MSNKTINQQKKPVKRVGLTNTIRTWTTKRSAFIAETLVTLKQPGTSITTSVTNRARYNQTLKSY